VWRRLLVAIAIVVALLAAYVVWFLHAAGEFRTITPHFDGTCVAVPGLTGGEDLTIHPRTGVAYVSSVDWRDVIAGRATSGALFAYDLNATAPRLVDVTPDAPAALLPHGVSLHVAADGATTLFVINHAGGRHSIEIYDVEGPRLTHRRTLTDPALVSPNDLVAVSPSQVYVTNDHGHPTGVLRTVEEYLRRPWANVVLWDGQRFREAAAGIQLANGINVSPDGRSLYVVSSIGGTVRVYERDVATGDLAFRHAIPLHSGGDNLEIDADGTLWVGSHPQLLKVIRYMAGGREHSPSQVLRVVPRPDGGDVTEIYLDDGHQLSASTVAAVFGKRLLIGPLADSKLLDCRMH
jgi:arylesterase / paraoxonase